MARPITYDPDEALDRAMDLLKGISLYSKRAPAMEKRTKGEKVAATKQVR